MSDVLRMCAERPKRIGRVYCQSCRKRHLVVLTQGLVMCRCNGMWWVVGSHPTTGKFIPIRGANKATRLRDVARRRLTINVRKKSALQRGENNHLEAQKKGG